MILVFGQTGQVARELARISPDAVCLGRNQADLSDPAACVAALRFHTPSAAINAAAYAAVDRAEEEEGLANTINGDAPTAMAQTFAELGIPFVHISTNYVFDGSAATPFPSDHPIDPLGAYGRTKRVGEVGVATAGGVFAILHTSWVFSAGGSNFVKTMLRLAAERDSLTVVADQIGGPTPRARLRRPACRLLSNCATRLARLAPIISAAAQMPAGRISPAQL